MALYRVMVSVKKDFWDWIEVEADSVLDAERKAAAKFNLDLATTSAGHEFTIEMVEELDSRPSKTSDEVWNQKGDRA